MSSESVPSPEHQRMVDSLAKYFRDTLKLNLEGVAHDNYAKKPVEFNGKIPDVVGFAPTNQLYSLGECELCEDIASDHTKGQLQAWSKLLMNGGKSDKAQIPIYVSVPRKCFDDLTKVLAQWGLNNRAIGLIYG